MEDVAFDQSVGAFTDVEGVSGVVEPVVVVGMPEAVEFELGGAAGSMVDVVSGECYLVVFAVSEAGLG